MSFAARMFRKKATRAAYLTNASYTRLTNSPCQLQIDSDGNLYARINTELKYAWLTGGGGASAYQVRSTVTSGTFSTDPSGGSWISCSSDRLWEIAASVGFVETVQATFEIRDASTLTVLASASIELVCDRQ